MKITTVEQELKDSGRCLIQTVGVSMEPLLHNRSSSVVLEAIKAPLKKNDVVLFKRENNSICNGCEYVLHRIIKVREHYCIIRGDNCVQNETVGNSQIIGVMTGYFDGDNFVDCARDKKYKIYVKSLAAKYWIVKCRIMLGKVKNKIFRKNIKKK